MKKLFIILTAAAMAGCAYHSVAERKTSLLREGSSLLQYGDLEQAETRFEEVLKDDAGDPYALNYMGNVYERQGRYQEALTMYQKAASRPLTLVEQLDAPSFNGMSITQLAEKNVERVRSIILGKVMVEVEATRKELEGLKVVAPEEKRQKDVETPPLVQEELKTGNGLEDVLALYQTAYNDFLNQRYEKALMEFTKVSERGGDYRLADNAHYWIAEIYYSMKDFKSALNAFRKVVVDFPEGNKVPDATLKIGYTYLELKDRKSAERILKDVIKSYPDTDIANLAHEKLSNM